MKIATLNFHRYFLVLLAILFWHSPLGAQDVDEGEFYLNFSGSAIFPYDPRGQLDNTALKAGTGFTAAFGYAFKEGFSTEMEWDTRKSVSISPRNLFSRNLFSGIPSRIDVGGIAGPEDFPFPLAPSPTSPSQSTEKSRLNPSWAMSTTAILSGE